MQETFCIDCKHCFNKTGVTPEHRDDLYCKAHQTIDRVMGTSSPRQCTKVREFMHSINCYEFKPKAEQ